MTTRVLGVSAFYHDSAAALAIDGRIVAAAQEERFSRRKHDPRYPSSAIDYCLEEAYLDAADLDAVVFYDNPLLTFDRALRSVLDDPGGEEQWLAVAPSLLGAKLHFAELARRSLFADVPVLFSHHHLSHAASAFFPSPFEEAAILTLDGVGEWATTSIARGAGATVEPLVEIRYPHSLGLLYSAFTYFTGFKVNSGEYKLMGLAPYGTPRFADTIRDTLIEFRPDGSYRLNMDYFGYAHGSAMTNDEFAELFEGPPRERESRITRREMDLAASIQEVIEEAVLGLARHAREITGADSLCLAGGVALNCVANGKLLREGIFDDLWIQPAAGDAGGAIGAALLASHQRFGVARDRSSVGVDGQAGSFLGPRYSRLEVKEELDTLRASYEVVSDPDELAALIAAALDEGKVVGHFSGRAEFGPRALGARSILGDPRQASTQVDMNLKIKFRESFRPFAPAVLRDRVEDYFELGSDSPYMLLVSPVRPERRVAMDHAGCRPQGEEAGSGGDGDDEDMLAIVAQARSDIPAVTHVDYSARVQTVEKSVNPDFHRILRAFEDRTGCGVLVNTSFNVRGEPIVGSPEDAYRCFMRTGMDLLVVEEMVLRKEDQPEMADDRAWMDEYELD